MNPLTNMKNVLKLSDADLKYGQKSSWHDQYKNSAWIFIGGLPYDLTEGDIISIFSQYGEIVNINLVRDKDTGKQKGFCFLCYEDQRSTVLAVDNLNGIKVLGRILRIDHVNDYKPPKDHKYLDDETKLLHKEGCAPKPQIPIDQIKKENDEQMIAGGVRLPPRLPIGKNIKNEIDHEFVNKIDKSIKKEKKSKKDKKYKDSKKKKKKRKRKHSSSDSEDNTSVSKSSSDSDENSITKQKKKRH